MDVSALFKQRTTRPITYQEANDELLGAYDRTLGIDTGVHGVGMSDVENPTLCTLLELWQETYVRERVYDVFHIDIDRFLDRPRWEIMMMLRTCARHRKMVDKVKSQIAADIENTKGG